MRQRVRVLIADDQQSTRQGLTALLMLYPEIELVGEAADGREAVQMVAKRQPDVVLMDMQMPEMDGLEATRHIKKQWSGVKVIGLTMYNRYQAPAISAGVDEFLIKSCSTETLLETILSLKGAQTNSRSNVNPNNAKGEQNCT